MSLNATRKRLARRVRLVMNRPNTPLWAVSLLKRIAHRIHPHVITCRLCGAQFVALEWWSVTHADQAWEHWVTVHEPTEEAK